MVDINTWYKYKLTIVTENHNTKVINYVAWDDDDTIDRSQVKRMIIEDHYSEVVAYQIESMETNKVIVFRFYDKFLEKF